MPRRRAHHAGPVTGEVEVVLALRVGTELLVVALWRAAPPDGPAFGAVLGAMSGCAPTYAAYDRERLRRRDAVVASSSELREREALKLEGIASCVTGALVDRGSALDDARLVADLSVAAFKQAARLWVSDTTTPYGEPLEHAADQSRRVLSGG